ncbi:family 43 glycosylhydrolase [Flavobacterium sp. RSSA_27]|uniref:family 43 glycosylhydrolase n=1 Tax=Flavobacterium sp. RSSA_27 TaxID=3447667 RepID=UPI003F342869
MGYYIYYPDSDYGIFIVKTKDPKQDWSSPILVKEVKGLIDTCLLRDEVGKVYLTYAFVGSRAGIKCILECCHLVFTIRRNIEYENQKEVKKSCRN